MQLEVVRYACQDWLITPAALALNEMPPASISEQKFVLAATGVGVFTLRTEPTPEWWEYAMLAINPDLDPALEYAIAKWQIPAPPGVAGNAYTRQFQVERMTSLVGLASIEGEPDDLVNRIGFAVDSWKARPFNTMTDAFTSAPLPDLFNGIDAELASWRGKMDIHRVNYQVTLIGRIVFAAVVIT